MQNRGEWTRKRNTSTSTTTNAATNIIRRWILSATRRGRGLDLHWDGKPRVCRSSLAGRRATSLKRLESKASSSDRTSTQWPVPRENSPDPTRDGAHGELSSAWIHL